MNLLARNWLQIKNSEQIIAIGIIVDPGKRSTKGYYSKSKYQTVDGGTGFGVQMAINNEKEVNVFDQKQDQWFRWSYSSLSFVKIKPPKIEFLNFAGIGTRNIQQNGIEAIKELYKKTFEK